MTFSDKTKYSRVVVLASYGGLLLALLANHWLLAFPLTFFAWSLWRSHWRGHIWLCFVLLFYFLLNINQLAQQPAGHIAWILWVENLCEIILFSSAMLWCRWSKRPDIDSKLDHAASQHIAPNEK